MVRFIFITGGVVSSLGKGLTSASLAMLLQARGFKVCLRKLDPYLNIDPGTMNPHQHGEVYVTNDGAETDLDLGHYERFTGISACKLDNITTGAIYSSLLKKEREGSYLGHTVQVIPHVTNIIKKFISLGTENYDFVLCEIGGTVGDIEGLPFFEAIRQVGNELKSKQTLFIHLTLLPYVATARELKTKPTQHSVKELRSIGISPDILLCRAERNIHKKEREKIALFCNLDVEYVIPAIDQKNIYAVPIAYHNMGLDDKVLKLFGINASLPNLDRWYNIIECLKNSTAQISIAVVVKYHKLKDAYKSVIEALDHAGIYHKHKIRLIWINSDNIKEENIHKKLFGAVGIIVPGGFGARATEGKILAIKYARTNNIPFLGICLGMQLALIEIARNILGIKDANSEEFSNNGTKIIKAINKLENESAPIQDNIKNTMQLGSTPCILCANTLVAKAYQTLKINERHRHRYKFNNNFKNSFKKIGIKFSGFSLDKKLVEVIEIPSHMWFVGVQFHPEFKSKPFEPHPLFIDFIRASIEYSKM
ncbi:CTP synthase [Rickettsia endosymbiont of Halotydeus destructor]|uniref:CTP synthase n=1 Tax=Rickettsia endosymbiont of Halotydeus destructor TaxID=2996754 RepID=UPI003BB21910